MDKKSIVIHIIGAAMILLRMVESINYLRQLLPRLDSVKPIDLVSRGTEMTISLAMVILLVAGIYGMKSIYALYCKMVGFLMVNLYSYVQLVTEHMSINIQTCLSVMVSFAYNFLVILVMLLYARKVTNTLVTVIVLSFLCAIPEILAWVNVVHTVGVGLDWRYSVVYAQFLIRILLGILIYVAILWCVENDRKAEGIIEKNASE